MLTFGPFRLDLAARELFKGSEPLHIRAREFDILHCLIGRAPDFVSKEELTDHVWPRTTVSEVNLRVQVAALRRILEDGRDNARYILSVTGRGYSFCAPISADAAPLEHAGAGPRTGVASGRHGLPLRLKPTIGRAEAVDLLLRNLPQQRLVTIVGPGGIGKTALALTAAEQVAGAYEDGLYFVDLAGLADANLVSSTVISTLGLPVRTRRPLEDLVAFLADKQILLILDNCEHVIGMTANLVERLLVRTRNVSVLATGREPLRIDGERVFRLSALDLPPRKAGLTASEAIVYPAVKLFVERARLNDGAFELTDDYAATVAELCHRLDGNPLALELAAARLNVFGIKGLVTRLDESFNLLAQGRRSAPSRHRTLRASVDWSYDTLAEPERNILRRLSIFRGPFSLQLAAAVAGEDDLDEGTVLEALATLVAKSLVSADLALRPERYRLLSLTRDYAMERLRSHGELDLIARRHAIAYLALLDASNAAERDANAAEWILDIRMAIEWAFSPSGDASLGMHLTASSMDLGRRLSLIPEYERRIEASLDRIHELVPPQPLLELRLSVEKMYAIQHTTGDVSEMRRLADRAYAAARRCAEQTGDETSDVEVISAAFGLAFCAGDTPELLRVAARADAAFKASERPSSFAVMSGRMNAIAQHLAGNHIVALKVTRKILSNPERIVGGRRYVAGDRDDPRVTLRIFRARALWMRGLPEQASSTIAEAEAAAGSSPVELCQVLAFGSIPIAFWRGDVSVARRGVSLLTERSCSAGLNYWLDWARHFRNTLSLIDPGESTDGRQGFPHQLKSDPRLVDLLATLHESLAGDEAVTRAMAGMAGWCEAEVIRAHTATALASGQILPEAAEANFRRCLEICESQEATSWQLRTATSLARLWAYCGNPDKAISLLNQSRSAVTEGFGDADVIAAEALQGRLERGEG